MRSTNNSRSAAVQRAALETLEARRLLSLAAPVSYTVGSHPQAIATADLNGDGRSDVVTGNATAGTVSVLLGNANGTLQPAQQFPTGPGPRSVAVGDVNNDGKRDIVAVSETGASILIGNGNGAFQAPSNVALPGQFPPGYTGATAVPQEGLSVAVGDVNADGKLDLVVGAQTLHQQLYDGGYGPYYRTYVTRYVNVLLGNGNGTFAPATAHEGGAPVDTLALGNFNNDNKLDVLAGDASSVALWLGNGNGTVQAPTFAGNQGYPTVGDFDNDGKLDFATGYGTSVIIWKGSGTGTFQNVRNLPVGTAAPNGGSVGGFVRSIVTGDVDNDGKLDLVVNTERTIYASYGYYGGYDPTTTHYTKVLLGSGDTNFSLPITSTVRSYPGYFAGIKLNATALGDVNGDGKRDVLAAEPTLDIATLQLNQGNWTAPVAMTIGDVAVTEGNAGTVNAVVTVTIDRPVAFNVSVPFATADGTATVAGGDYFATSGTLTFSPGQTSRTITVQVRGDRVGEGDEAFYITLGEPVNAVVIDLDGRGTVTITDDEPRLTLSTNTSVTEGNTGTKTLNVTATLSAAYDAPVTFNWATLGGSASSGTDFVAATGTVSFSAGQTSKPIAVAVKGDTIPEYSEGVYVTVSGVSGALWDGENGSGTIVDDDAAAAVAVNNVTRAEGNAGTTAFVFTCTRLTPSERESWVHFSTASGTASSGGGNADYSPVTEGTFYFSPGQVNATAVVAVKGDTRSESDETFFVNLTTTLDATISDGQAVGTILNDESRGKRWVGPDTGGDWSNPANWSPAGVPTATSLVSIDGDAVTLSGSATVAELSLFNYAQLTIAPGGNRVFRTGALFLGGPKYYDGRLDLSDNDLIVDYAGGGGNASPIGAWNPTGFGIGGSGAAGWYDGILGSVADARDDGRWDLLGITTSRPDAGSGRTALAVAEASQVLGLTGTQTALFDGQPVDATSVLVKYTYAGDANFDGAINIDDYTQIDSGGSAAAGGFRGWFNGDFNYDEEVNIDDYTIIDSNVGIQGPPL